MSSDLIYYILEICRWYTNCSYCFNRYKCTYISQINIYINYCPFILDKNKFERSRICHENPSYKCYLEVGITI